MHEGMPALTVTVNGAYLFISGSLRPGPHSDHLAPAPHMTRVRSPTFTPFTLGATSHLV